MWNCSECNTEVDDKFDNCPKCGTGRDGSEAPVDFVRKQDAVQPNLPAAGQVDPRNKNRLVSILIVIAVIIVLFVIAFGG